MAKQQLPRQIENGVDTTRYVETFKAAFRDAVTGLEEARKTTQLKFFQSGIEFIQFTIGFGDAIEFSIVVAGKDAPGTGSTTPAAR